MLRYLWQLIPPCSRLLLPYQLCLCAQQHPAVSLDGAYGPQLLPTSSLQIGFSSARHRERIVYAYESCFLWLIIISYPSLE